MVKYYEIQQRMISFFMEVLNDPIGIHRVLSAAVEIFKGSFISIKPTNYTHLKFYRPILLGFIIPEIQAKSGVHLPSLHNSD